jgi:hypothetical protein
MAISDIPRKPGPPCSVCLTLTTLTIEEASALRGLLADPEWRYSALSERLAREGTELTPYMLSHHARGRCGSKSLR